MELFINLGTKNKINIEDVKTLLTPFGYVYYDKLVNELRFISKERKNNEENIKQILDSIKVVEVKENDNYSIFFYKNGKKQVYTRPYIITKKIDNKKEMQRINNVGLNPVQLKQVTSLIEKSEERIIHRIDNAPLNSIQLEQVAGLIKESEKRIIHRIDTAPLNPIQLGQVAGLIKESEERTNKGIDALEKRIENLELHMNRVEKRLDEVEKRLDKIEKILTLICKHLGIEVNFE